MSGGYEVVEVRNRRGTHHEAVFSFDADDLEGIAGYFPSYDKGGDELLEAAEAIRKADEADPDAPGLAIVVRRVTS